MLNIQEHYRMQLSLVCSTGEPTGSTVLLTVWPHHILTFTLVITDLALLVFENGFYCVGFWVVYIHPRLSAMYHDLKEVTFTIVSFQHALCNVKTDLFVFRRKQL